MKRTTLTLIYLLLLSVPAMATDITFAPGSIISNDTITLSDIASFSDTSPLARALGSQIVGSAPDPGRIQALDAREIIKKIQKLNNINLAEINWTGSAIITVARESTTISYEKIEQIITDYITENLHRLPEADISFIPDSQPLPFQIQTGSLSWDVIPSSPDIIGSSRFSIIFKVNGKVRKNMSVNGRIKAITPVVISTRRLKYGETITPDSVIVGMRDISSVQSYSKSVSDVTGSIVKRTINQGAILGPDSIAKPPIIKRGELVKITVNYNGLVLTATGIAKSDGLLDEMIRVKNVQSNKLIYCRVQAPGLVEVTL